MMEDQDELAQELYVDSQRPDQGYEVRIVPYIIPSFIYGRLAFNLNF